MPEKQPPLKKPRLIESAASAEKKAKRSRNSLTNQLNSLHSSPLTLLDTSHLTLHQLSEEHVDALHFYAKTNNPEINKHMDEVEDLFKKIFNYRNILIKDTGASNTNYKLLKLWFDFIRHKHKTLTAVQPIMNQYFNQMRWNYLTNMTQSNSNLFAESFLIDSLSDYITDDKLSKIVTVSHKIVTSNKLNDNLRKRFNTQWVQNIYPKLRRPITNRFELKKIERVQQQVTWYYLYSKGSDPNLTKTLQWTEASLGYDEQSTAALEQHVQKILKQPIHHVTQNLPSVNTKTGSQTVLTVNPEHCKANLALNSSQHDRIKTMVTAARTHSEVNEFHDLSTPWKNLLQLIEQDDLIKALDLYNTIDAKDPVKSAMETIHGKPYILPADLRLCCCKVSQHLPG